MAGTQTSKTAKRLSQLLPVRYNYEYIKEIWFRGNVSVSFIWPEKYFAVSEMPPEHGRTYRQIR